MKVKGEWKHWLKAQHSENEDHGIRSHHFMANRWVNSGNSVRLYFWGSKITVDGDCSHEIKRHLLLGRKTMTNLDSVLKSRDITLLTNVRLVKAMVFSVVVYECESWTIKQAEHRIDPFELWCWRRFLRVPWTARRSNQSILKEISPEYIHWKDWCWIWRASTLVTRCEELTHWKSPWCWKNLKAEGEGDDRGWDGLMASLTWGTWVWASSESWWWIGKPGVLQCMGSQRVTHEWVTELNLTWGKRLCYTQV